MEKHTPGPWEVAKKHGLITNRIVGDGNSVAFTTIYDQDGANAHLIATAPELLAFAEKIVERCSNAGFASWLSNDARELVALAKNELDNA